MTALLPFQPTLRSLHLRQQQVIPAIPFSTQQMSRDIRVGQPFITVTAGAHELWVHLDPDDDIVEIVFFLTGGSSDEQTVKKPRDADGKLSATIGLHAFPTGPPSSHALVRCLHPASSFV